MTPLLFGRLRILALAFLPLTILVSACNKKSSTATVEANGASTTDPVKGCESEWFSFQSLASAEQTRKICTDNGGTWMPNANPAGCKCASGMLYNNYSIARSCSSGGDDNVAMQDRKACDEKGGIWMPNANPANGCKCASGIVYGAYNIKQFCKPLNSDLGDVIAMQDRKACDDKGGVWMPNANPANGCKCALGIIYGAFNINQSCRPPAAGGDGSTAGDQDQRICNDNGGTWMAYANPPGCKCSTGMQYSSYNIKYLCKASAAQQEAACTSSGGKWYGANLSGTRCACSAGGQAESNYPPEEVCGSGLALTGPNGSSIIPDTMPRPAVELALVESATTAAQARVAYEQCKLEKGRIIDAGKTCSITDVVYCDDLKGTHWCALYGTNNQLILSYMNRRCSDAAESIEKGISPVQALKTKAMASGCQNVQLINTECAKR